MKKLFTLLLLLPLAAIVYGQNFTEGELEYQLSGGNSASVWGYIGSPANVEIPSTVTYDGRNYSVTSIGGAAFRDCSSLESVTLHEGLQSIEYSAFVSCSNLKSIDLPSSVTSIGSYAFSGCSSLESVTLHEGLQSIGNSAFANCTNLKSIDIPSTVTRIGSLEGYKDGPFYGCTSLESVTLHEGLQSIGSYAFSGCSSLKSIDLPVSVTNINISAFRSCNSLASINVYSGNANYSSIDGVVYDKSQQTLILCPEGKSGNFVVPSSVTTIGEYAFYDCAKLTSIEIPSSVTNLGEYPFYGCTGIKAYKNYSEACYYDEYGWNCMVWMKELETLVCPANELNSLSDTHLLECSKQVKSITVHSGTLDDNGFAFVRRQQKTLESLDLGDVDNNVLNDLALYDCYALKNLVLPANLERIGYKALAECVGLLQVDIPASVTEIEDRAFENCRSMTDLDFITVTTRVELEDAATTRSSGTSSLQRIGNWAFYNCHQLQNLTIPEGVTEVGSAAFYGCTYLADLELPSTLRSMGDNCFALCSRLGSITALATEPCSIEPKTFYDVNRQIPVYVPEGSVEAYQNASYWEEFQYIQEDKSVNSVNDVAASNIYAHNGRIYVDAEEYAIYDLTGQDVSSRNGSLSGLYIVVVEGNTVKIRVN